MGGSGQGRERGGPGVRGCSAAKAPAAGWAWGVDAALERLPELNLRPEKDQCLAELYVGIRGEASARGGLFITSAV